VVFALELDLFGSHLQHCLWGLVNSVYAPALSSMQGSFTGVPISMPFCFHSICGIWLLLFQQNIHMALSVNQQRFGVILWTGICNIDSKRGLVLLFTNFRQHAWMPSEYALEPPICVICVADSPVCNEAFIFPIQLILFNFVV
jgi:hypothetical protein